MGSLHAGRRAADKGADCLCMPVTGSTNHMKYLSFPPVTGCTEIMHRMLMAADRMRVKVVACEPEGASQPTQG